MSLALITTLAGIAVFDSLNPSLFVAQFFLFAAPRPTARVLSYIAGVLAVNFLGGLLILGGARVLIGAWLASLSPAALFALQGALGLALVGFGLWFRVGDTTPGAAKPPRSLRPLHTFLLGMVVMLNEITTALPYFIAIEQIAQAQMDAVSGVLALVLYNGVFALPLVGFLGLFLAFRERAAGWLERMNRWLALWVPRVIKYGSIIAGLPLAANAAAYFLTGAPLV